MAVTGTVGWIEHCCRPLAYQSYEYYQSLASYCLCLAVADSLHTPPNSPRHFRDAVIMLHKRGFRSQPSVFKPPMAINQFESMQVIGLHSHSARQSR